MVQIILADAPPTPTSIAELYIPHGSDNTPDAPVRNTELLNLYIPHGSDNTWQICLTSHFVSTFISHMVQIIQKADFQIPLRVVIFISHMVQIIQITCRTGRSGFVSLYPTWFR